MSAVLRTMSIFIEVIFPIFSGAVFRSSLRPPKLSSSLITGTEAVDIRTFYLTETNSFNFSCRVSRACDLASC